MSAPTTERERKARRTASRRPMQNGGVLYASWARNMSTVRAGDEVEVQEGLWTRGKEGEKVFIDAIIIVK